MKLPNKNNHLILTPRLDGCQGQRYVYDISSIVGTVLPAADRCVNRYFLPFRYRIYLCFLLWIPRLPVSLAVLHPHQELHARSMHHGSLLFIIIINLVP
jgi:hypothetical protein